MSLVRIRHSLIATLSSVLLVLAAITLVPSTSSAAPKPATPPTSPTTTVRTNGYLPMADGVRLKWTLIRPAATGKFPVLMQYDGYNAGNNPARVNAKFVDTMLASGYAVLGVSVRGTACSDGVWDVFDPKQGEDGKRVVEWAAKQPWSTGKVGMFSFSFAGMMQLMTARTRPAGLAAIAPGMVVADNYRDIGYPGGITNFLFPAAWEVLLHVNWAEAATQAVKDQDFKCLTNIALQQALNLTKSVGLQGLTHPFYDGWMKERSPGRLAERINVPVLGEMVWQDEQTGPRGSLVFNKLNPATTWTIGSNGHHGMYADSPLSRASLKKFFDHYIKGANNGWEKTPHVQVGMETKIGDFTPSWLISSNARPLPTTPTSYYLGAGTLSTVQPPRSSPPSAYLYPSVSPNYLAEGLVRGTTTSDYSSWSLLPPLPHSYAAFTTPALTKDITLSGTASLDLWMKSTAPDADVQATVTEVRPDGKELYVQRGWLRLSHRAIDAAKSTSTDPYHPHTKAAQQKMKSGVPALARVEIQPFAQTFRKGSKLRVWLDTPSATGLWDFLFSPIPSRLTVLHDAAHPSKLTVGVIPGAHAKTALPACGTLVSQACRKDPLG